MGFTTAVTLMSTAAAVAGKAVEAQAERKQAEEMEKKLSEKGLEYRFKTTVKKVGNYYSFT